MDKKCSILKTMNFIGRKWTLLVFIELYKGRKNWKRYNELKKVLPGITPKVLSQRLKEMEKYGLIKNKIDTTIVPNSSSYSLTECGKELINITNSCKAWVLKCRNSNTERENLCSETDCMDCPF